MREEPRSWANQGPPVLVRQNSEHAHEVQSVLEAGGVVALEGCAFPLEPGERELMDPSVPDPKSKNVSYDPATGRLRGTRLEGERRQALAAMTARSPGRS